MAAGASPRESEDWDFFLSYAAEDRPWAEWVAWHLEADGYRVLIQAWDFVPGSNWQRGMHRGVTQAQRTIALLSPSYLTSRYGQAEWQAAYAADPDGFARKLLPIRIKDCARPGPLGAVISIDLFDLSANAALARLRDGIRDALAARAKPAVPPSFPGVSGPAAHLGEPEFPPAAAVAAPERAAGSEPSGGAPAEDGEPKTRIPFSSPETTGERAANEREGAEIYMKAVDQFGSDRAVVRLGGLHALERIGQTDPGRRQNIVELICTYLRMPFMLADDQESRDRMEERQVRQAAQRILSDHLRDESYMGRRAHGVPPTTFWPEIEMIDLRGSYLIDFNLSHCRVEVMQFHDATFSGDTLFRATACELAFFQNSTFSAAADFRGATFANSAWFSYTTFRSEAWFHGDEFYPGATFGRHVSFQGSTFTRGARLGKTVFAGSVDFSAARYEHGPDGIRLDGAFVRDPDAVSPEISQTASNWPPGWTIVEDTDGARTLSWSGTPQTTVTAPPKKKATTAAAAPATRATAADLRADTALVSRLYEAVAANAGPDGWTSLSAIGLAIRQHPAFVLKTYGYASLRDLLVATDLFDLQHRGPGRSGPAYARVTRRD
jgi:hypothetical protein